MALHGIDVRTSNNGKSALNEYREFHPEVCIIDIGLPDLNGYEVMSNIQNEFYQARLNIALTGYGQRKDREAAEDAGFDHHIVKPVDPEELLGTIAQRLQSGRRQESASSHSES